MPLHETDELVLLNPSAPIRRALIWCHGLGADGHDFVPLAQALNLPPTHATRFIFPHAPMMPVTLNGGYVMRAWFDIFDVRIDATIDESGINHSKARIHELIQNELAQGLTSQQIYLGGFSQGAVMALTTGLTYPERLGGLIALSGFLPHPETILAQPNHANAHTPIFMAHGREDEIVPYALGKASRVALTQAGYRLTWHDYEMGHHVCPEEVNDLRNWLMAH